MLGRLLCSRESSLANNSCKYNAHGVQCFPESQEIIHSDQGDTYQYATPPQGAVNHAVNQAGKQLGAGLSTAGCTAVTCCVPVGKTNTLFGRGRRQDKTDVARPQSF
eukprot:1160287-Pelagomonas_calceolata.AAC.3